MINLDKNHENPWKSHENPMIYHSIDGLTCPALELEVVWPYHHMEISSYPALSTQPGWTQQWLMLGDVSDLVISEET